LVVGPSDLRERTEASLIVSSDLRERREGSLPVPQNLRVSLVPPQGGGGVGRHHLEGGEEQGRSAAAPLGGATWKEEAGRWREDATVIQGAGVVLGFESGRVFLYEQGAIGIVGRRQILLLPITGGF
jgi:hypothetical protein